MRLFSEWLKESYPKEAIEKLAGKAHLDISNFDIKQIQKGMKIEREHGKEKDIDILGGNEVKLFKVVIAHLREKKDYYDRIVKAGL